jgi:predicted phosphodiesterase
MRMVVLSDIHANAVALAAVLTAVDALEPDQVVVAGDTINRGPSSRRCLETILERRDRRGWHVLKGNHEDYVLLAEREPYAADHWAHELFAHTRWTVHQVRDLLPLVRALPDHLSLTGPDGGEIRFLHASMQGNRSGLYEDMPDERLAALVAPAPPVLVAGHTHIPFVRAINGTLIVNAGSAGLPFDGDPRVSFALLEWRESLWTARIIRVPYDRQAAENDFISSGYLADGGPMIPLILDELRHARPRLGMWHRTYERAFSAGEISLKKSVQDLLNTGHDFTFSS